MNNIPDPATTLPCLPLDFVLNVVSDLNDFCFYRKSNTPSSLNWKKTAMMLICRCLQKKINCRPNSVLYLMDLFKVLGRTFMIMFAEGYFGMERLLFDKTFFMFHLNAQLLGAFFCSNS